MFQEFKEFINRGNVLDMAVGIVIGAAFGAIVKTLVDQVIMPPIGLLLGGVDFSNFFLVLKAGAPAGPYAGLAQATEAGAVTLNYGVLVNNVITFLIVAFAVFLVVKVANRIQRQSEESVVEEPAAPPPQEVLLAEIRDLLKAR